MAGLETVFGDSPKVRVLNFLIVHKDWDYNKSEIAREAGVSWKALFDLWPTLEKRKLVVKTRQIGRATMFKLDTDKPLVQELIRLFDQAAIQKAEELASEVELAK